MKCANSSDFFEVSKGSCTATGFQERLLCLKDFLKKLALLPFAIVYKASVTLLRAIGIILAANILLLTLGTSSAIRVLFIKSMSGFAKDLADWILLPFAILSCFCRVFAGFFLHPSLYFNSFA